MADHDDTKFCPDCGELIDENDIFSARMEAIHNALDGADDHEVFLALSLAVGEFLASFDAGKPRNWARRKFSRLLGGAVKHVVVANCDA